MYRIKFADSMKNRKNPEGKSFQRNIRFSESLFVRHVVYLIYSTQYINRNSWQPYFETPYVYVYVSIDKWNGSIISSKYNSIHIDTQDIDFSSFFSYLFHRIRKCNKKYTKTKKDEESISYEQQSFSLSLSLSFILFSFYLLSIQCICVCVCVGTYASS